MTLKLRKEIALAAIAIFINMMSSVSTFASMPTDPIAEDFKEAIITSSASKIAEILTAYPEKNYHGMTMTTIPSPYGGFVSYDAAAYAASKGATDVLRVMFEQCDLSPNHTGLWGHVCRSGRVRTWCITLLHLAADSGCAKTVTYLLEKGADHSLLKEEGDTVLSCALSSCSTSTVVALLDHGADADMGWGMYGYTPLRVAAESGQVEILRALLTYGAKIEFFGFLEEPMAFEELKTTDEIKRIITGEKKWRARRQAVYMTSGFASANLFNHLSEDVARYIAQIYL